MLCYFIFSSFLISPMVCASALLDIVEHTKYTIAATAPIGLLIYRTINEAIQKFKQQIFSNFNALLLVINTFKHTITVIMPITNVMVSIYIIPIFFAIFPNTLEA